MRRLILVRHGPTHAKGMIGWSDLPADLSDTSAITALANWLPQNANMISSDLIRTVTTADAIRRDQPRLPHDPNLREMHFGAWEQMTWAQVSKTEPDRIRNFYETPGDISPPGGESWNAFSARVSTAIDHHLSATEGDLIVVCHFGVILSQVQRATGKTPYETFGQKVDNFSGTEIAIKSGKWSLTRTNHICE